MLWSVYWTQTLGKNKWHNPRKLMRNSCIYTNQSSTSRSNTYHPNLWTTLQKNFPFGSSRKKKFPKKCFVLWSFKTWGILPWWELKLKQWEVYIAAAELVSTEQMTARTLSREQHQKPHSFWQHKTTMLHIIRMCLWQNFKVYTGGSRFIVICLIRNWGVHVAIWTVLKITLISLMC